MSFAVGSLVKARGREWVVLPESTDDLVVVRPLGGADDEVTGIYLPLEKVEPAQFELPSASQIGDFRACRLLRSATRLGFRSSAGPFRSFGEIAVEPRPYQLVPLLMALKQDPVRMLIADDVGIGKTIEACLIARELMDRGEVRRLAVLCPPALAEQWQAELKDKFHIEAELVLSSTVTRLERHRRHTESLFDVFPHVVVSIDFIKADRRRDEFLRACPELVIVDEAHACASSGIGRSGRHQRFELVRGLAAEKCRHLILVTATPHSGNEDAFRSLLSLLDDDLADLPSDLSGRENEPHRRRLAQHFVQRRRGDIRHYLDADTPFPEREEAEDTYKLSADYKKLFERVLAYARETVQVPEKRGHRRRVRWWSALALLRSLASSPAAAAATLRTRAAVADTESEDDADEIGRRTILDMEDDESTLPMDATPGGDFDGGDEQVESSHRRRLLDMAREADRLRGDDDAKLKRAAELVKKLLADGFRPIVFCRFIDTADYLAEELRKRLRAVEVVSVTGLLPPADREERVEELAKAAKRVLVCTDCLSEGINLQRHFDAVLHYDLSWNPTRHEQREGRVDRYGQAKKVVRALTYYGLDNQIDGVVLDVLLRKHRKIRNSLGISVPVPVDTERLVEAIFEGLLLRGTAKTSEQQLFDFLKPQKDDLFREWEAAGEREKRSQTMFAQHAIKVEEVARELEEVRSAVGSATDVAEFCQETAQRHGAAVGTNGRVTFDLREAPRGLRELVGSETFHARFELPVDDDTLYLNRTHPIVAALASYTFDTALDAQAVGVARRAGVIRTRQVERRTTLLLLRLRFDIVTVAGGEERSLLAEDCQVVAFRGSPETAEWLDRAAAESLWSAEPDENVNPDTARDRIQQVIDVYPRLQEAVHAFAVERAQELLVSHRRLRDAARIRGMNHRVEAKLPVDVLGVYVYLPAR